MKMNNLLENVSFELVKGDLEQEIKAVAYDSRKVVPGTLFVCMKGLNSDGHEFIGAAVEAGAVAVVVEDDCDVKEDICVVKVADTREALAYISAAWFEYPAKDMTVIGVTGTKGKTTTTHMIRSVLEEAGHCVGMIGTLGAYIGDREIPTQNTTPESYEIHRLFAEMRKSGCDYVVMEVSSQGLKQKRVAGITFNYGGFLNLSVDHIGVGEHADFEEYKSFKKLFFSQVEKSVMNIDCEYSEEFLALAPGALKVSCGKKADFMGQDIRNKWNSEMLGVDFHLGGKIEKDIVVSLPGAFNVQNALVAIGITYLMGISPKSISHGLKKVSIKGRTQVVKAASHIATFLIDYAHNELSMESLLQVLKAYEPNRLICLFGAGGNRAKQRRFDMGKVAGKYADLSIITTDNPRFEEVEDINKDIIEGLDVNNGTYKVIVDRKEAIEYLLDTAQKGDIVALIGKGHEKYQEIRGEKHAFCEEQIIKDYVGK